VANIYGRMCTNFRISKPWFVDLTPFRFRDAYFIQYIRHVHLKPVRRCSQLNMLQPKKIITSTSLIHTQVSNNSWAAAKTTMTAKVLIGAISLCFTMIK